MEQLEDRRMLTTIPADVVILLDASVSERYLHIGNWFNSIVPVVDAALRTANNDIDPRYGLVAFGEAYSDGVPRFAYSRVMLSDPSQPNSVAAQQIWSSHSSDYTDADLVGNRLFELGQFVKPYGVVEDGWDAIDHALAEYDFRPGAVPVFILVQNSEGRNVLDDNTSLTHDGVLAALKSKNVILDTLTVGLGTNQLDTNHLPLFDLAPYESPNAFADIRVLGVDADAADGIRVTHLTELVFAIPVALVMLHAGAI